MGKSTASQPYEQCLFPAQDTAPGVADGAHSSESYPSVEPPYGNCAMQDSLGMGPWAEPISDEEATCWVDDVQTEVAAAPMGTEAPGIDEILIDGGKRFGKPDAWALPGDLKDAKAAEKAGTLADQAKKMKEIAAPKPGTSAARNAKVMKAGGVAVDGFTVGNGVKKIIEGVTGDEAMDDVQTVEGIGDVLSGGSGLLGTYGGGAIGPIAQAFTAGYGVGEMLAPFVFGDMEQPGARMEDIPEDGVFKPSTGNSWVDGALDLLGR